MVGLMKKVNLANKFSKFSDIYSPKVVAEINNQYVKLVRFKGAYPWHHHDNGDEMFMSVKGTFNLEFRDHVEQVNEGEFCIAPKGVEHRPVASDNDECLVMLFEPKEVVNTGNIDHEYTLKPEELDKI